MEIPGTKIIFIVTWRVLSWLGMLNIIDEVIISLPVGRGDTLKLATDLVCLDLEFV